MREDPTVQPADIVWDKSSPVMSSGPVKAEADILDDEIALDLKPGLGLRDVTGTNWTSAVGEKKFVSHAGDVLATGLEKKYLFMNGQALVTDSRGKVYLGDASNRQLIQYLKEKGYTEVSKNPDGVSLYAPQATDKKQV